MNAARQILRRFGRAMGTRTRSTADYSITATISVVPDHLKVRSFQYCDDLIEAFRRYMELPKSKIRDFFGCKPIEHSNNPNNRTILTPAIPVINTGNPGEYTIKQLAEEVLRQMPESKSKLIYKPLPSDDPKKRKPDITLAHALLNGWEPKVPLQEGRCILGEMH